MQRNTASALLSKAPRTHEGAIASRVKPVDTLTRSVLACLLWEDSFYESGESIAARIAELVPKAAPHDVATLAMRARSEFKLRHVPLFLAREMARHPSHRSVLSKTLESIIQRPDELAEFLNLYFDGGVRNQPIANSVKRGLSAAFRKFDEYSLAKYNRDAPIKLRDVLFLIHAKPRDHEQAQLWKRLAAKQLATPDTWEVELSKSADKKASWERLLRENKLGGLALLRNLRNFQQAGVDTSLVFSALAEMRTERILPFRFVAAARYAPQWEPQIEQAMLRALESAEKLPGKTAIVVDNSGSMYGPKISAKSELDRIDAACALAILIREVCEEALVIGFGSTASVIPARRGFALRDAIRSGPGGGTNTQFAVSLANQHGYDRIVIVTDEQSHQTIANPNGTGYIINVASYQNGIGYGPWTHITGFSESVVEFIRHAEAS